MEVEKPVQGSRLAFEDDPGKDVTNSGETLKIATEFEDKEEEIKNILVEAEAKPDELPKENTEQPVSQLKINVDTNQQPEENLTEIPAESPVAIQPEVQKNGEPAVTINESGVHIDIKNGPEKLEKPEVAAETPEVIQAVPAVEIKEPEETIIPINTGTTELVENKAESPQPAAPEKPETTPVEVQEVKLTAPEVAQKQEVSAEELVDTVEKALNEVCAKISQGFKDFENSSEEDQKKAVSNRVSMEVLDIFEKIEEKAA